MASGLVLRGPSVNWSISTTVSESSVRWLKFARFRQKAVQDPTGAWWEDDKKFDIKHHVKKAKLPGRAGKRELQDYVSQMASEGLDFTKPLWQFHLVENYQEIGRASCRERVSSPV